MRLGLGTGSTARWFIHAIGERVRIEGLRVAAVPTSSESADMATTAGIPLIEMPADGLDLAVDGADCVDPRLRLIKGRGGAHVREKIVAAAAARFVVIVDDSKLAPALAGRLPVELLEFGSARTLGELGDICGVPFTVRSDSGGRRVRSDSGNLIADSASSEWSDAEGLAATLDSLPGVVGHGFFIGMAELVVAGNPDGSVVELTAP